MRHFRAYEEAYFEFNPHVNLICGANAQGKTSLIEAIHCLVLGRSFRSRQSAELIKHGTASFHIEGKFLKHGIEQSLKMTFNGQERCLIYNSTPLPTLSSLLGILPGVVIAPDDFYLIKGPPLLRRQFLDIQIAQSDPLYVHHLTRYSKAIRQRNQLLKSKQLATIESWERELSQAAAYIYIQRRRTVQELHKYCQTLYQRLTSESEPFEVHYKGLPPQLEQPDEIKDYQLKQFQKYRLREVALGYTLTGPHKDDLFFTIKGKDVRDFASEGQQRSCVTTLRLAEWQRLSQTGGEMPLMIIDDIGLSLDTSRRHQLLEKLIELGQIFLTSTDEMLLNPLSISKTIIKIHRGSQLYDTP